MKSDIHGKQLKHSYAEAATGFDREWTAKPVRPRPPGQQRDRRGLPVLRQIGERRSQGSHMTGEREGQRGHGDGPGGWVMCVWVCVCVDEGATGAGVKAGGWR